MSRAVLLSALFLLLGCDNNKPPAASPSGNPDDGAAAGDSGDSGSATAPSLEKPADIPDACWGDLIDLSAVLNADQCAASGTARSAPEGAVAVSLANTIDVAAGGTISAKVYIQNKSTEVVVFDIAAGCDPAWGFTASATQGAAATAIPSGPHERIADWDSYCAAAARCGNKPIRIALAPSKRAVMPMAIQAKERGKTDDCKVTHGTALAAATYTVSVTVPLVGTPTEAQGTLRVK